MSNSVSPRECGGHTLVYLMKYSGRGKNKSSKIQFSLQPTAAFTITNHIIYTNPGKWGGGTGKGARAPDSRRENLKEDAVKRWRVQAQFILEARQWRRLYPPTTYILEALRRGNRAKIMERGPQLMTCCIRRRLEISKRPAVYSAVGLFFFKVAALSLGGVTVA